MSVAVPLQRCGVRDGIIRPTCRLAACVFISTFVGCEGEPPAPPPPIMTAETAELRAENSADDQTVSTVTGERRPFDGLEFAVPAGWEEMPLTEFQRGIVSAKFSMPKTGPDVKLTLSRSGGGVEANLDRWRGQVSSSRQEVKETISVAGIESTLIDLQGSFADGLGGAPQNGMRMIGIIVPMAERDYFMKLTGPSDQVAAVEADFRAMAKSAAKE